ncbi:hypothetical protein P7C73_g4390, partial [Tremellales sp. Uapishka_1]
MSAPHQKHKHTHDLKVKVEKNVSTLETLMRKLTHEYNEHKAGGTSLRQMHDHDYRLARPARPPCARCTPRPAINTGGKEGGETGTEAGKDEESKQLAEKKGEAEVMPAEEQVELVDEAAWGEGIEAPPGDLHALYSPAEEVITVQA